MTGDLDYGAEAMREVFETYAQIAKSVIETDPRDVEMFTSINRYLDEILSHWTPEHQHPGRWELEYLEEQPDADPRRMTEVRRRVAENEKRIRVKDELVTWRAVERFALVWWIQRRLRESRDDGYVEAWRSFVGYFGNVAEAARAADRAMQADFEDRGRWMHWVPTPLHTGASYGPAIDLEFLQTFVLIALEHARPDGPPIQLEPLEWLSARASNIEGTVRAVVENEALRRLVPKDRLEERAVVVIAAFESMMRAREEREDQRVIEAPLDSDAVSDFKQRLRSEWATHRLLAGGFQRAGTYEVIQEPPSDDVPRWGFGRRWMPKNWLITDPRVGGFESHAAELGRDLGESEAKIVVEAAEHVAPYAGVEGASVAQLLRGALADLGGYDELIVLASHHWRWPPVLELTLGGEGGGPVAAPPWLPTSLRSKFLGTADGVPVIASTDVPEDRLLALSLAAFAAWRQWRAPGQHEVTVGYHVIR